MHIKAFGALNNKFMKYLNYQKGISPIIAVIIFAVILIGGAYYFRQQQTKPVSKPNISNPSFWVNPFESSSIKWKTFSIKNVANSENHYIEFSTSIEQTFSIPMYGIQFSLPPVTKGSITSNYSPGKSPVIEFSNKKFTECNQYGNYYQNNNLVTAYETAIEIRVPIVKITNAKEWFDACEKPISYPKGIPTTETSIINGTDVLFVKDRTQYIYDQYMFVKNGIVYIFDFDNRKATPETLQQVQQMLDSIKFSQPTIRLP